MALLCYAAKFYPFLSLDCAGWRVGGTIRDSGHNPRKRKGSNFAIWQQWPSPETTSSSTRWPVRLYFGRRSRIQAQRSSFPFSELVTKMALNEISPFRPRWSEERAFKRLYFHWVNAQVILRLTRSFSNLLIYVIFCQGPPHHVSRLQRGCG